MIIKISGEDKKIRDGVTVSEILALENVDEPNYVSVQLNGEFVERDQFGSTVLKPGDEIDFLYFMGGGTIGF